MQLRPYQETADARLRSLYTGGARRVVLVAPTGAGKTIIAAHWIRRALERGHPVAFVVGRRQIVEQTYERLTEAGIAADQLGIWMGRHRLTRPDALVQIACTDTLARRDLPREPRLVIVDECHQGLTKYVPILQRWPGATVIGLTATPIEGMGAFWQALEVCASVRELTDLGHLARARYFTVPEEAQPDLRKVPLHKDPQGGEDFAPAPLAEAVNRRERVGNLVAEWRKHAEGVPTVGFAVDIAHAETGATTFNAAGIPAAVLHSRMTTGARAEAVARFRSGAIVVLWSVDCLSEGFDEPAAKCAILDAPTEQLHKFLQRVGRVLRPFEGQVATVIDPVGNVDRHGLATDLHAFSLTKGTQRTRVAPLSTCPACLATFEPANPCPVCGFERVPRPGVRMRLVAGDLVEVTGSRTKRREPTREEFYTSLVKAAFQVFPQPHKHFARAAFVKKRMAARYPTKETA